MIIETGLPHLPYKIIMTDEEDDVHMDWLEAKGLSEDNLSRYNLVRKNHSFFESHILEDGRTVWHSYFRTEEDAIRSLTAIGKI